MTLQSLMNLLTSLKNVRPISASQSNHTLRAKKGCEKKVTNTFRAVMRAGLVGAPDQLRITS